MAKAQEPPPRGKNYDKNKRTSRARQRRARTEKRTQPQMSTGPNVTRRLKAAVRRELHRQLDYHNLIMPWIKDLNYRYVPMEYERANLLGLPTELRQKILYESLEVGRPRIHRWDRKGKAKPKDREDRSDDDLGDTEMGEWESENESEEEVEERRQLKPGEIGDVNKRIGELSCVCPLIRIDMAQIGTLWRAELRKLVRAQLQALPARSRSRAIRTIPGMQWLSPEIFEAAKLSMKRGNVIEAEEMITKKYRLPKCWYCEQRHFGIDPSCQKLQSQWYHLSKPVTNPKRVTKASRCFKGAKVIFNR